MITIEGYQVTLRQFLRMFFDKEFYIHYYHKWFLCKFFEHECRLVPNEAIRKCIYCKKSFKLWEPKK